jgi:predicted PurR-regulated permease PerM
MATEDRTRSAPAVAAVMIVVFLTLYWVIEGRRIFVPIAVSVIVWYLLNSLAKSFAGIRLAGRQLPGGAALAAAGVTALAAIYLIVDVLAASIAALGEAVPRYEQNLERLLQRAADALGLEHAPTTVQLADQVDLEAVFGWLAGFAAGLAGNLILVLFYVIFLFVEQASFDAKLSRMVTDPARRQRVRRVLDTIQREIRKYLWIKFLMGLSLGAITYVTLVAVGVDFPAVWSFIIFLLSFIPTIGTLLGIVFPAVVALLQFNTLTPFLIITAVLGAAQLLFNNMVEPRLMGKSLNLSPFLIFVMLAVWGTIWGITGAVLCVPLMVMAMIVLSQFPRTRAIAVAMSSDGDLPEPEAATGTETDMDTEPDPAPGGRAGPAAASPRRSAAPGR